ncbi:hypothetical protein [Streptomyces werraensis]|uniref:hypothetical protein n=1 Tax=Streptomyces werraensis TaxID=68284 RepID=UPI00344A5F07
MDQGIAGLLGAAIGGAVGVVGTMGAARLTSREQRRAQHDQWRRQVRRDAYSAFILEVRRASEAGKMASHVFLTQGPDAPAKIEDFYQAAHKVQQLATLVSLEGPEAIADASTSLVRSTWRWVQMMRLGHWDPGSEETRESLLNERSIYGQAVDDFARKCREVLDK